MEEEKKQKIDMRNRALKDYEIFYSEFEEIKEKEGSLNESLKKQLEEHGKLIMSIEYLKQQNLYKDQEFNKLLDEQNDLKSSIKDIKEGKAIYNKPPEDKEKSEDISTKDEKVEVIEKKCSFC